MQPTRRQTHGIIFLLVLTVLTLGYQGATLGATRLVALDLVAQGKKDVVVELEGEVPARGIFFLPPGSTFSDLLHLAGIVRKAAAIADDTPLATGKKYHYTNNAGLAYSGHIGSEKKFLLGMTLNVNSASREALMLIPGVGEKTAERIIRFRRERGGLTNIEELKEIRGIKDKRLGMIRGYLHVGEFVPENH